MRSSRRRMMVIGGVVAALAVGTTTAASLLTDSPDPALTATSETPLFERVDDGLTAPATGASSVTVPDVLGDSSLTVGDLSRSEVGVSAAGVLAASVQVAEWTDPTSDDWQFGDTGPTWRFDTDGDDEDDHRAEMRVRNGELQAVVFDGNSIVCVADAMSDSPSSTYGVEFDVGCVGNPEQLRYQAGLSYDDVVFEIEDLDLAPDSGWSGQVSNPAFTPPIVTLDPFRYLDTRPGGERLEAGATLQLSVVGRGGVPDDARAVFLNVTAIRPGDGGFITVFPCGFERPTASNLNFKTGDIRPNAVLAQVGVDGEVCIYTLAAVDLVVDVNGYVPARSDVRSVPPQRYLDTRSAGGRVAADSVTEIQVLDRFGVPRDADGVVLNVTAVNPTGGGFLTVFPCGNEVPVASNVNYAPGDVVPNAVVAKVGERGRVCVYSFAETHLVIDVNGYVPGGSTVRAIDPHRLFDSRTAGVRIESGEVLRLDVLTAPGVAPDASGVVLNVTSVRALERGFVTVFPCGAETPEASNLNYEPGSVVPNAVVAKIGEDGQVCVFVFGTTHLLVDVNGYLP